MTKLTLNNIWMSIVFLADESREVELTAEDLEAASGQIGVKCNQGVFKVVMIAKSEDEACAALEGDSTLVHLVSASCPDDSWLHIIVSGESVSGEYLPENTHAGFFITEEQKSNRIDQLLNDAQSPCRELSKAEKAELARLIEEVKLKD